MSNVPPWQRLQESAAKLEQLHPDCRGTVHPLAVVDGVLELGEGSVVKAGTVIEGHVRTWGHKNSDTAERLSLSQ